MNLDESDKYVYQSLGHGRQIRILLLQPTPAFVTPATRSTIKCSLEEADLDDRPQYTALSYSWATEDGDDTKSHRIEVDGKPFPITRNLYDALIRFRSELGTVPLRLWVDAVCINQADNTEKSRQVGMIAQIYGAATRVIAWLGESRDERQDAAAYATLRCLAADHEAFLAMENTNSDFYILARQNFALSHRWAESMPIDDRIPDGMTYGKADEFWRYRRCRKRCPKCTDAPNGLVHKLLLRLFFMISGPANVQWDIGSSSHPPLLERRWFRRRRVMQEVNIPKEEVVCFQWGSHRMSKKKIRSASRRCIEVAGALIRARDGGISNSSLSSIISRSRPDLSPFYGVESLLSHHNVGSPIVDLVRAAGKTVCADPRDLIFSLLSMASTDSPLEVDYTLGLAELFIRFARLLVREGQLPALLTNCCGVDPSHKYADLSLPSWVPDLRRDTGMRPSGCPQWQPSADNARCRPVCSEDGVLSVTLYLVGRLGEKLLIAKDEPKVIFAPPGKDLGKTKSRQGRDLPYSKMGDVVCTLEPDRFPGFWYCYVLKPVEGIHVPRRMKLRQRLLLNYHPFIDGPLPELELVRIDIV